MRVCQILIFIGDSTLLQFVQHYNGGGVIKLQTVFCLCYGRKEAESGKGESLKMTKIRNLRNCQERDTITLAVS